LDQAPLFQSVVDLEIVAGVLSTPTTIPFSCPA
jgi:hypothetical protein